MVFLVTIVLGEFLKTNLTNHTVATPLGGSYHFSGIIETTSKTQDIPNELNVKIADFVKEKKELSARNRYEIHLISLSVNTI